LTRFFALHAADQFGRTTLAILADFLGASPDPRDYANPRSDERAAWLLPRAVGVGEAFELSAREIEEWVVGEGPTLTDLG
jgi:hypothetical protein